MSKASLSVIRWCLARSTMKIHPFVHNPSRGIYSYIIITNAGGEVSVMFWSTCLKKSPYFSSYSFTKINLHFSEEFTDDYTKIWLDVHTRNMTLMTMVKEIHFRPPSLVKICQKHIMENFEINELKKMKEIVPDMKF